MKRFEMLSHVVAILLALASGSVAATSLYDANSFRSLTQDAKATAVGDSITILIVEAASAESRSDTSSEAEFGVDAGLTDASGLARAGASIGTESGGAGRTARIGRVQGQLSARVEQRLESGQLLVKGHQLITINGERQQIAIEGYVRPEDISPENTVLSSRLSDARIQIDGEGWVSSSQRPGLFRRLLHFIGITP